LYSLVCGRNVGKKLIATGRCASFFVVALTKLHSYIGRYWRQRADGRLTLPQGASKEPLVVKDRDGRP